MKNQKGISSLIGIVIIVAVAVVAIGGVFTYQYISTPKENNQLQIQNEQQNITDNYSFEAFEEGDLNSQQYFDYSVGIYKNGNLLKKISIKNTRIKPSLFVLSPDKKYVVFKTAVVGGTCVYISSPMVIDLNNFSVVNLDNSDINKKINSALGIDTNKVIKFSTTQEISDIKWMSNNEIKATMQFGDNSGCPIMYANKPANSPDEINASVVFTITK